MSRRDRLLYVRKQLQKERENSFPPLERNPAWDEEDRKRWSRYPLKPEFDPNYIAPEATTTRVAQSPGSPVCADFAHNGVESPSAATEESLQADKILSNRNAGKDSPQRTPRTRRKSMRLEFPLRPLRP